MNAKANNYHTDFYGWTQEQAALLKAGRLAEIDMDNIIEEIETMGRSEKRELQSRLTVLLVHLLKWQYQPIRRGKSWELTIKVQRDEFQDVLQDNPGLKPLMPELLKQAYKTARNKAALETKIELATFPDTCPWDYPQITDESYYPE